MNPIDITIHDYDAVVLLSDLCEQDKPVTISVGEVQHDGDNLVAELIVNHEEDHVPDFRILLNSDGTWQAALKLVPEV